MCDIRGRGEISSIADLLSNTQAKIMNGTTDIPMKPPLLIYSGQILYTASLPPTKEMIS